MPADPRHDLSSHHPVRAGLIQATQKEEHDGRETAAILTPDKQDYHPDVPGHGEQPI